jgi:hypothetical protein
VKIPAAIVPAKPLPPRTPSILQVTAVFVALVTVAAKASVLPSKTDALPGVKLMLTAVGADTGWAVVTEASVPGDVRPHPANEVARHNNRKRRMLMSPAFRCVLDWPKAMPTEMHGEGQLCSSAVP